MPGCCTSSILRRLPTGCRPRRREEDWLLLRPNLERLADFADWFEVLHGEIEPPELGHDERLLVKDAAAIAERLDWSPSLWRALTDELKATTGKKGRELFHPLRLALTGRESGPGNGRARRADGQGRARSAASKPPPSAEGWRTPAPRPYLSSACPGSHARRARAPRSAISPPSCASAAASSVIGAALAVLVTMIIVIEFLVDAKISTAPPPQVVYVELYPSNRTDAEIIADQKKDQAAKEAAQKERQRQFQKLEKQLGM